METELTSILSLITGGILWEGLKFVYPDIKNYFIKRHQAKKIIFNNLDSIIKAADELYGKLESLTKEDFSSFKKKVKNSSNSSDPEHNKKYVLYLFAQFWASLENIRLQSNYTSIARIKKGEELLRFIDTIESRKFRILDRSKQRIIGEGMIINANDKFKIIPLYSFLEKIDSDKNFSMWINELELYISSLRSNSDRQRILIFGIVVAALLNHFDPNHKISRRRSIYSHRIKQESSKLIKHVLLEHYLKFIKNKKSYYIK